MGVKIQWQPPLVLEERKKAQWEKIIRHELGEVSDSLDVSLRFEEENLRWKVDASAPTGLGVDHGGANARPRGAGPARSREARSLVSNRLRRAASGSSIFSSATRAGCAAEAGSLSSRNADICWRCGARTCRSSGSEPAGAA